MSEPIALRCSRCERVSYRPVGFVRAKSHFVCNYCHDIVKIDRHEVLPALTQHRRDAGLDVFRAGVGQQVYPADMEVPRRYVEHEATSERAACRGRSIDTTGSGSTTPNK
jgi:hypothetical protein